MNGAENGPFEHERARLHALVDLWVDALNEDSGTLLEDQRIDVAMVGGILRGTDAEGEEAEGASMYAECRAIWQQVGLLTELLDHAAHGHPTSPDV